MDIKLIACDLDETLLCLDRSLTKRNREAVRRAMEAGIRFVPASGRGYMSIQGTLKDLGLWGMPDQYIMSFNGGAVTENRGNRLLYLETLDSGTARALYRAGQQYDVCIHVYTAEEVYCWGMFPSERDFLRNRQGYIEIDDTTLDFLAGEPVVKILYTHEGYPYLERIQAETAEISGHCEVSYSSGRYLEFNKAGISKGTGLRRLCEHLGIDISQAMAIGDNINDLSMIREAGLGCAVANVYEGMREECDYVSPCTNDESGVAEIIERFCL